MTKCELCGKEYPAFKIFRWDAEIEGRRIKEEGFPEYHEQRMCVDCMNQLRDKLKKAREEIYKKEEFKCSMY